MGTAGGGGGERKGSRAEQDCVERQAEEERKEGEGISGGSSVHLAEALDCERGLRGLVEGRHGFLQVPSQHVE